MEIKSHELLTLAYLKIIYPNHSRYLEILDRSPYICAWLIIAGNVLQDFWKTSFTQMPKGVTILTARSFDPFDDNHVLIFHPERI